MLIHHLSLIQNPVPIGFGSGMIKTIHNKKKVFSLISTEKKICVGIFSFNKNLTNE